MTEKQAEQTVRVRRIRTDPRIHWLAMIGAIAVGIALSTLSWLGIVVGGALVGLVATSLSRAILAGVGFGIIVILAWGVWLAWGGAVGAVFGMGIFVVIPVAMALGAAVLGSLVRGVV